MRNEKYVCTGVSDMSYFSGDPGFHIVDQHVNNGDGVLLATVSILLIYVFFFKHHVTP